jgi:acetylornithine deacetylase/succinyl-diaminopimelate desuccinylase-like protein
MQAVILAGGKGTRLAQALGMETVFFSFAVGDEDIHAPNEFFRLQRFGEGRRAWADLLARLPEALARGR